MSSWGFPWGSLRGILTGFLNGWVIAKLNVNPFVTTLGSMTATRGIAMLMTGGLIISDLPHSFNYIGIGFVSGIPLPVIYMIIAVIIGHILLAKTEFGLNTYAIGGNFKAARLAGLKNDSMIIKIYTLSGFLSALGGIILTARVVSAQPGLMMTTNLDVIAAVVVGGTSLAGRDRQHVEDRPGIHLHGHPFQRLEHHRGRIRVAARCDRDHRGGRRGAGYDLAEEGVLMVS